MSKSHSFSIYLLKDGYDASSALKENHKLDDSIGEKLPEGAQLYILDNAPTPPWWKEYFGIDRNLLQSSKGAVIFLSIDSRMFAITFGHVHHNFREECYEYDFGLRVTLNCLDPDKLKSTDVLEPNGAKRQRTQVPVDSDLTYFDFDRDTTILKSLTGKVRSEHKKLFKHATGASNIRISSDITPDGFPELCKILLNLYMSDTYKKTFPDIQNISPVRDPVIKAELNENLVEGIKNKKDNILLNVPEMLNYHDGLWAKFCGAGQGLAYDDVSIDRYYDYLEKKSIDLNTLDIEIIKKHCLVLTNEEGAPNCASYAIFKCLIFDTVLSQANQTYHLCDGNWYCVEGDFIKKLSDYLDPLWEVSTLNYFTQEDEGAFNKAVENANDTFICLDTTSIAPQGQKAVEPCDLYELKDGKAILHHIKISTLSAQLSHLFNQGANSIHLLRDNDEAKESLKALLREKLGQQADEFLVPITNDAFKIIFGVITTKDPAHKSRNFPLFSRISLMRVMKDMKRMGVDARFCFIKDESPPCEGKKKRRASRKMTQNDAHPVDDAA